MLIFCLDKWAHYNDYEKALADLPNLQKVFEREKGDSNRKAKELSYLSDAYTLSVNLEELKKKLEELQKNQEELKNSPEELQKALEASQKLEKSIKGLEKSKKVFDETIEKLRKEESYKLHFDTLHKQKTIKEIMEYINSIIETAQKEHKTSLEQIRKFYLSKFLQEKTVEIESYLQDIIDEDGDSSNNFDIQAFKEKLMNLIQIGTLQDVSFDGILTDLEGINFSKAEDKENLKYFLDALATDQKQHDTIAAQIEKLKGNKELLGILDSLEKQTLLSVPDKQTSLFSGFKKLEEWSFTQMVKTEKVLLRDFLDKKPEEVVTFINSVVLGDPADKLDEIITLEKLEDIREPDMLLLGRKLLFDHTKQHSDDTDGAKHREKDFNKTEEELAVFSRIFRAIKPSDLNSEKNKNPELDDEGDSSKATGSLLDYSEKIPKMLEKIEKLESILLALSNDHLPEMRKAIVLLSAQYLLEDIGQAAHGFTRSQDFLDYGYVSISKRQFLILNIARKAMAHYPMHIDDEKLEFYTEQLLLDSQFRLQQLGNSTLPHNAVTVHSNEFANFSKRREISFQELEEKKKLIKGIIFGHGFSHQVIVFNKQMGCDIGTQGDVVFVVFPITGKASFICELELGLSYNLHCDVRVYTPDTLDQSFLNKLTKEHQAKILAIEEFDDFLTTKKFEQIFDDNIWIKAILPSSGAIYKGQSITKEEFATAKEVEYVFDQQYKNAQREKTNKFRQDRIEKIKEIEDIISYKASQYAQKICEALIKIEKQIGLDNLKRLFDILILDRLVIERLGMYFIENEYPIRTEFPELSTSRAFRNYAYAKPEEFFSTFSRLINTKALIENRAKEVNSLASNIIKEFDKLGLIISQLRGVKVIEHIKRNITHFLVEDNYWLLFPAIFTNLKDKYCDDDNILKIYLGKKLEQKISTLLQQYGYLLGAKNVEVSADYTLLDFSGEVEYAHLKKKEVLVKQLQSKGVYIINQILSDDLSILDIPEDGTPDSTEYTYIVPHVSNSILGFSSELDQDAKHIHEQIAGGYDERKALLPNLFIENFIDIINGLLESNSQVLPCPKTDVTFRFQPKISTLQELLQHHKKAISLSEKDNKKVQDYYGFRHLSDELNIVLHRINKHIQEAKNLQELIILNNSNNPIKQLQQQKLEKIIVVLQQDYRIHIKLIEQIFSSSYAKERILKVLQNPFELQNILTFIQSQPVSVETQENLLKKIISHAISIITLTVKQELYSNVLISNETITILTDDHNFMDHLTELAKSLVNNHQNEEEVVNEARIILFKCIVESTVKDKEENMENIKNFVSDYPDLVEKIAKEQPLYFKVEAIAEVAIGDQSLRETVIAKIRESLSGAGEAEYKHQSYWNEYSQKGIEEMLALRFKTAGIDENKVKIIYPDAGVIFNDNNILAHDLVPKIDRAFQEGIVKVIIPANLYGKHWVGITVERLDGVIKVTYINSEGNPMPKSLSDGLKAELARLYPDSTVEIAIKEVELQKSNNCGLEVIENLIAAIAGEASRIDQEEALDVHSILYVQSLILEEAWREKALQEENAKNQDTAGSRASNIPTKHYEKLETVEADKEAKIESINVIALTNSLTTDTNPVQIDSTQEFSEILMEEAWTQSTKQSNTEVLVIAQGEKVINSSRQPSIGQEFSKMSMDEEGEKVQKSNAKDVVTEAMDKVWEDTQNSDTNELDQWLAMAKQEEEGSKAELESMEAVWSQTKAYTAGSIQKLPKITDPKEIVKEASILTAQTSDRPIEQQPVELKKSQSHIGQQTQIAPSYEAPKVPTGMGETLWKSAVQCLHTLVQVDPYEAPGVMRSALHAGGCAAPTRSSHYSLSPELRETLSQNQSANRYDATKQPALFSFSNLFDGAQSGRQRHAARFELKPLDNTLSDIPLSAFRSMAGGNTSSESWLQQFEMKEVDLSGKDGVS